ncbi:PEP-CTERM sorting domain-containing protein [Nostoc sp. UHCC 0702]|nr:PEP-CTERM sorting domain-containing protein [Nostoc sp. UHCC 0702]
MNKQLALTTLAIFTSLIGESFLIAPASAQLIQKTGIVNNTLSSPVTAISNTSTTGVVNNTLSSPITAISTTSTNATQGTINTTSNLAGITNPTSSIVAGVTTVSQTTATVTQPTATQLPYVNNTTQIIQNTAQATASLEAAKGINSKLQETTTSTIGSVAGVSTDSVTTVKLAEPTQAQLSSLSNPTQIIQQTGQATVDVQADQQGAKVNIAADLTLKIGDLAEVNTCLDAEVLIGSSYVDSLANCSKKDKPRRVPEPTLLGGLAVLGLYLISRNRKVCNFAFAGKKI